MKKNNAAKLFINLVFILIITYAYQDFKSSANVGIREADRGIVHIILFVLIGLLAIYFVRSLFIIGIKKDKVKGSLWLITGWVFIVGIIQSVNIWALLVHLGLSTLWIFIYHFGKEESVKKIGRKSMTMKWVILLLLFYVYASFYAAYNIRLIYGTIPVINLAYYVIVFFPWISLHSSNKIKKVLYLIITFVVLASFKRGAIIIFPLMLSIYSMVKAKILNRRIMGVGKIIVLVFIFIIGLIVVDNFMGGFILNRFTLKSLASGSGRVDLYSLALNNIANRSLLDFFIGLGSGSSVQYLGTGAHNEWIEFTFNFGIIGTILYAKLLISLIHRGRLYIKEKSKYAPAYASMITYMVVIGLFGGLYFVHSTLYVMMFLGTIEGLVIQERNTRREMSVSEKNRYNHIPRIN